MSKRNFVQSRTCVAHRGPIAAPSTHRFLSSTSLDTERLSFSAYVGASTPSQGNSMRACVLSCPGPHPEPLRLKSEPDDAIACRHERRGFTAAGALRWLSYRARAKWEGRAEGKVLPEYFGCGLGWVVVVAALGAGLQLAREAA